MCFVWCGRTVCRWVWVNAWNCCLWYQTGVVGGLRYDSRCGAGRFGAGPRIPGKGKVTMHTIESSIESIVPVLGFPPVKSLVLMTVQDGDRGCVMPGRFG